MAGKKYWDVMYTLRPSTSLQMPNNCIVRESNPGSHYRMWTLYHWALESVHNMGVLTSQYFSPNAKYCTASSGNRTRTPLIECGRCTIELRNLYIIWACLRPSTSLQMPNNELHCPVIEPLPARLQEGQLQWATQHFMACSIFVLLFAENLFVSSVCFHAYDCIVLY